MKTVYGTFNYQLPPQSSQDYASRAIPTLQALRKSFPKLYKKNFRCPSEVLTISGVRAFDTYYDLGNEASAGLRKELEAFFAEYGILYLDETAEVLGDKNEEGKYSLVNQDALKDIPNRYGYIPGWTQYGPRKMQRYEDFALWWLVWQRQVAMLKRRDTKLPLDTVDLIAASNDVPFGMLLGYPGEAIMASILIPDMWDEYGKLAQARIAYGSAFDGAEPIYSYPKELADNPNIMAHETLWSEILEQVYAALGEKTE